MLTVVKIGKNHINYIYSIHMVNIDGVNNITITMWGGVVVTKFKVGVVTASYMN